MKEKSEYIIVKAREEDVSDIPEWFYQSQGYLGGTKLSLENWAENYSTKIKTQPLYTKESESDDMWELDDYILVLTDEVEEETITTATDRYNLIQNSEVVENLLDVIDYFNIGVVGYVRDYKAKIVLDIYPNHNRVLFESPDVQEALAFGIELRVGHDKKESVKVRPIIQDNHSDTTVRGMSEWTNLRHVKPEGVESKDISTRMTKMFSEAFFKLGYLSSSYMENVKEAYRTKVDFSQEEFNIEEFYSEWLNENYISNKVKEVAPRMALVRDGVLDDMVEELPEVREVSVWALISGYTYALSNASSMSDGYQKDMLHQKAASALRNPDNFVSRVREAYNEQEEEDINIEEKAATMASDLSSI